MKDEKTPAVQLLDSQMETRSKIRDHWKNDAGNLIDAHQLALSAVARVISRFSGRRFEQQSDSAEGRLSLIAQFIQGVDACETTVSEGLYSQAAALLKQEMEIIEAIFEFEQNKRKDRKVPRPGGQLAGFERLYGELNDIAHVSKRAIAKKLVHYENGNMSAASMVPRYNYELMRLLYGLHVYFIFEIARKIEVLFQEIFKDGMEEELKWLWLASRILKQEGIIKEIEGHCDVRR